MRTWLVAIGLLAGVWLAAGCGDSVSSGGGGGGVDTVLVADNRLYVPHGFTVNLFAEGLTGVRTLALAPDGAVFAALSEGGEIVRLVDTNGDGVADQRTPVLTGLGYPFGLAFRGDTLYFAEPTGVS